MAGNNVLTLTRNQVMDDEVKEIRAKVVREFGSNAGVGHVSTVNGLPTISLTISDLVSLCNELISMNSKYDRVIASSDGFIYTGDGDKISYGYVLRGDWNGNEDDTISTLRQDMMVRL